MNLNLMATLWPTFPHFARFANDNRLSTIRMNSSGIEPERFKSDLAEYTPLETSIIPLGFDIKGRQLRVLESIKNPDCLDVRINHPIQVKLPATVYFKGGNDEVILKRIEEDGRRLIFDGGGEFNVGEGESLHIPDSFVSWGSQFIEAELEKIAIAVAAGFNIYFQSYVQSEKDYQEFRELVGPEAFIWLKIEDRKGLEFVAREFRKRDNVGLVAARGDMFVELGWPSDIASALRLIIEKDPEACVASRILLSVQTPMLSEVRRAFSYIVNSHPDQEKLAEIIAYLKAPRPISCADILELTWLADLGYQNYMLCDELCLNENLLAAAIDAFEDFKRTYVPQRSRMPITPLRQHVPFGKNDPVDPYQFYPSGSGYVSGR